MGQAQSDGKPKKVRVKDVGAVPRKQEAAGKRLKALQAVLASGSEA